MCCVAIRRNDEIGRYYITAWRLDGPHLSLTILLHARDRRIRQQIQAFLQTKSQDANHEVIPTDTTGLVLQRAARTRT